MFEGDIADMFERKLQAVMYVFPLILFEGLV